MVYVWGLLESVLRIVFLRGSPERIPYTRKLFITALLLALASSAAVQALFFADHLVFVILTVFAEVTMFMIMMVMLTAKMPRYRLARVMLVLVLINLLADVLLICLSGFAWAGNAQYVGYGVGALAIYGASNCLAWGLKSRLWIAAVYIGLYVAAKVGLDLAFRGLYQIMAAG